MLRTPSVSDPINKHHAELIQESYPQRYKMKSLGFHRSKSLLFVKITRLKRKAASL